MWGLLSIQNTISLFVDVTAILFVVACDSYNLSVPGDPTKVSLVITKLLKFISTNNTWPKVSTVKPQFSVIAI